MQLLQQEQLIMRYSKQLHNTYAIDTAALQWRHIERGQCLYEQGYPLMFLAFLLKGKVKIYTTSEDGNQLIVAFNQPLELYGDVELIQQVDMLHTIEAVTDLDVALLPITTATLWRQDAHFNELLLRSISRKFLTKSTTLSFHLLHEADVRLASYLLAIAYDEHGQFLDPLIPKSELKLIAQFIGVSVRHQNRCLQLFEQAGMIQRVPGHIRIANTEKLQQHAKQHMYDMQ